MSCRIGWEDKMRYQRSADIFYKGPDSKYFSLSGPHEVPAAYPLSIFIL